MKLKMSEKEEDLKKTNDSPPQLDLSDFDFETKCKTVCLYGEIAEEVSKEIISSLYFFNDNEFLKEKPINFLITTEGGNVQDMFAIYDCMRDIKSKCNIQTYGVGKVMSAGVLLLAAGSKGFRKLGRNCRLMLHPVSGGQFGSLSELETDIKEVRWYQTQFIKALAHETKMPLEKIHKIFDGREDIYFNAEEALKWGIVDELI